MVCCFYIKFCCKDSLVWIELRGCYRPVDELLHCSSKIAQHQFVGVNSAVDWCTRLPLPTLIVCQSVFGYYFAMFVDGVLRLDIEKSEKDSWNLSDFVKWE